MLIATRILSRISLGRCAASSVKGIVKTRQFSCTNSLAFQQTLLKLARQNIVVPPLAESLSEGDVKFEKSIGDVVTEDDLIASIETDKTSIPINSPVAGKIVEFLVEDSSTVKPGQNIIVIDTDSSAAATTPAPAPKQEANVTTSDSAPSAPSTPEPVTQTPTHQPITPPTPPPSPPPPSAPASSQTQTTTPYQNAPSTSPFAQQKSSVSIESAKSGLDSLKKGQFSSSDGSSQQRSVSVVKMNRMRQRIASRLKDAQNTYAMLTTFNEIDMSNLIEMRQKYKDNFLKKHSVKLGFMSAFVKASAYALKDQPVVNAVIEDNQIMYRDFIDISVAVATPKGLVVPVLRNVEHMNFADIEKTINHLGERAKNNALTVADMEGGTFTISNGGVFGSLFGTPIINPPQSAILGMHAINDKPAAVNGQVLIRPIMVVALTYDHRLIDGREAVTFLKKIKEVIEDPRVILLEL